MRQVADSERIRKFIKEIAKAGDQEARIYLAGGASAVLIGWRPTTIDVDIKIVPENDSLLRAIPNIKESLQINVELASPDQFLPPLPDWKDRSVFITREGKTSFYHYDFYAQALGKMERRHQQDVEDVRAMFEWGLIEKDKILEFLQQIEPELYHYPAIDPPSFRKSVEEAVRQSD